MSDATGAIDGPIVVYQMGKVGSRSVYHSLCAMGLEVPIYHIHLLNHLDEIEAHLRKAFRNPNMSVDAVEQGRALRAEIEGDPDRPWRLVSLVRDPVARNISRFFQGIEEMDPEIRTKCEEDRIGPEELGHMLVTRWERQSDRQWFDTQVKEVFGIDVYARPFGTDRGFDTYGEGRFSMLVLRLENLNERFAEAMQEFLGIPEARLKTLNKAEDKWYGEVYRRFVSEVTLPGGYLDEVYGSKFARHFYTPEELAEFRRRWGTRRAAAA